MNQNSTELLRKGIAQLGVVLPTAAEEKLHAYLALLAKWNRSYNLTAVRDETLMVSQHLLDSLAVLPHLNTRLVDVSSLADVGSGGGLPGIPLAIARPQLAVALIESSHKKASFLQQAKIELKLNNVSIHCVKVEDFKPPKLFEVVISRAFSSLAELVRLGAHLLAPGGRLLAMKGVPPNEEIAQVQADWRITRCIPLHVPELGAQRNLVIIEKTE
ncbi:MAG: 16S rRNA (guanine(527)-N(7))-methyltransferase RsmG [Sterolibacterium sp.]|nr:16S rRNA (guanine(527)-N(7))-methyltransferase RsmG [Sterolibacterium sp.]